MKNITQISLLLFSFFYCITTNAQLEAFHITGEAWAKGDLVEIGLNSKGVFGANHLNKPSSFHTNREDGSNGIFGFIANPADDGWIDYDGGFFTPGAPEEGFNIEINGQNYGNNNVDNLFQIEGEIKEINVISSDCGEDTAQIIWEGNIQGLNIKRYYSITQKGLFIKMETVIENLGDTTKENVFFMHNVDPDNNVTLNGRFDTDMKLVSQANTNPEHVSLVTASQRPTGIPEDMDGSKISFYANEPNARVTYGGFSNRSASNVWYGVYGLTNEEGSILNGVDKAISIAFKLDDIEPLETVNFTYYYVLEKIDPSFDPIIVSTNLKHPVTCDGDEGKIILSGLSPNESYTVSYMHDGTMINDQPFTSNNNGELEILNLGAGAYTDLTVNLNDCLTRISSAFELIGPEPLSYSLEKTDITDCENINGQIKIYELSSSIDFTYQYDYNGTSFGPINATSNSNGEILITDLERGTYTNFTIVRFDNCSASSNQEFEITAPEGPNAYPIPEQFYCDDDEDYITTINLSDLNSFILGTDNAADYEISYYLNETDITPNISLPNTNYTTTGLETYTLFAKKTSLSDFCYSYIPFTITIKTAFEISLNSETICVNSDGSSNFEYESPIIFTDLSEDLYHFEWYFEGDLIPGETQNNLVADSHGTYTVIATDIETNCSVSQSTDIVPSGPPEVLEIEILSPPFSGNHTIEINTSGYGNYEYAMDNGAYQTSPIFSGISSGLHIFSVRDINGCGIAKIEKTLMDYLQHFSPNNDGYHDYWKVNTANLKDPEIYIFDRKGKLLKELNPEGIGWDGKFRNEELPTSDYWVKILYKDADNNPKEFMANFTLKR